MDDAVMCGSSMMLGMGLIGALLVLVLAFVGAAAVKYLFFSRPGPSRRVALGADPNATRGL